MAREEQTSSKRKLWEKIVNNADSTKIMAREVPTPSNQDQGRLLYSAPNGNCSRVSNYMLSDCPFTVWPTAFSSAGRLHDDNSTRGKAPPKHPPTLTVHLGSFTMNVGFKH